MDKVFGEADVGRKNMLFGIALFLILGVGVGIPLTINFFGGSVLTAEQYQTWKVVHGYGIFLGFINYFYGLMIDRLNLTRQQKEISSWSMLAAALFGGAGRMTLVLVSALDAYGVYASLGETVFITLATAVFVVGQLKTQFTHPVAPTTIRANRPPRLSTPSGSAPLS